MYPYFHYERPENVYFLYFAPNENRPFCTLRRYNPETIVRERLHVLYEMHPLSAPCPSCHLLGPPLLPLTRGDPVSGSTPPSLHDTLPSLFLLHRYLHELPEPICCRGIIFGFVVVAPLSFPP